LLDGVKLSKELDWLEPILLLEPLYIRNITRDGLTVETSNACLELVPNLLLNVANKVLDVLDSPSLTENLKVMVASRCVVEESLVVGAETVTTTGL
jgi:hypothetical protein